jgi:hypothetical protein
MEYKSCQYLPEDEDILIPAKESEGGKEQFDDRMVVVGRDNSKKLHSAILSVYDGKHDKFVNTIVYPNE